MAIMNFGALLLIISIANSLMFAEALKCYQCGQYTDGAGSITPCLNYTEQTAPHYLKDCPRSSSAYCIVSVLIIFYANFFFFFFAQVFQAPDRDSLEMLILSCI